MSGVGGATIREAKERITSQEAGEWARYIEFRGTLNIGSRIDRGFAMLARLICIGHNIKVDGKIPTIDELMPGKKKPKEICTDINQAFAFLKSVKKNGN